MDYNSIPILYYHSIANHPRKRPWSFLSYSIELFEEHIKFLHSKGYQSLFMNEVYNRMSKQTGDKKKSVALHFDDGFLDNWVFAFPILKKYNMKATIYINPEFVDPSDKVRPNLDDVKNKNLDYDDLSWWGYLSWKEMRIMEESGLIDIQSHSLTHTWYFSSDRIIDFHHPNDHYYWLYWNKFPDKKPTWLTEINNQSFELGRPIYEHGKSLTVRKYFEDVSLKNHLISFVKKNGNEAFFNRTNWKDILFNQVNLYKQENKINDKIESEADYRLRIKTELLLSKQIIEKFLDKKVEFLCWPGGGQNEDTFQIAYEVGYKSTTKGKALNKYGQNQRAVSRLAANTPVSIPFFQKWFDLFFLRFQLNRGHGGKFSQMISTFIKRIILR